MAPQTLGLQGLGEQFAANQHPADLACSGADLAAAGALRLHVRCADMSLHRIGARDHYRVSANSSRQHPGRGAVGASGHRQGRRPTAAVPPDRNLRPLGRAHSALEHGEETVRATSWPWLGICGVRLQPLAAALKDFILGHAVLHADETPVALLAPGRGKTEKAFVWVYRTTDFATGQGTGRACSRPSRCNSTSMGTMSMIIRSASQSRLISSGWVPTSTLGACRA